MKKTQRQHLKENELANMAASARETYEQLVAEGYLASRPGGTRRERGPTATVITAPGPVRTAST